MFRIVSRSWARASSSWLGMNVPPTSEEKVAGSWLMARTSACLVMAQNPVSPGSGCQWTGSSARSRSNWSWGTPWPQVAARRSMPPSESVTVTGLPFGSIR